LRGLPSPSIKQGLRAIKQGLREFASIWSATKFYP
jgi:hypothetical protein